jgi:hypothetical protein
MTKNYCDCCESEIEGRVFKIPFLKHITENDKFFGHVRVKDGKMERISGVDVCFDFCLTCYNELMGNMFESFQQRKLYK